MYVLYIKPRLKLLAYRLHGQLFLMHGLKRIIKFFYVQRYYGVKHCQQNILGLLNGLRLACEGLLGTGFPPLFSYIQCWDRYQKKAATQSRFSHVNVHHPPGLLTVTPILTTALNIGSEMPFQPALYTVGCTLWGVHCGVYTVGCTLWGVHCGESLLPVQWPLYPYKYCHRTNATG